MALHVDEHMVLAFDENVRVQFAQNSSRLRGAVDVRMNVVGESKSFDRVANDDANEKTIATSGTGRHEDHTEDDLDGTRSWAGLRYFYKAIPLDPDDEDKLLADPKNKYVTVIAGALGRKMDEIIIDAMVGNAARGLYVGSTSNVALPTAQLIANGSTGLTIAKLRSAKKILDTGEVPDSERYLALNAKALSDLLGTTEATSSDFNTVRALVNGELNTFLGFSFIRTEKINTTTGCVAWHKSAVGLAIAREYNTIWQRTDKHGLMECYGSVHFGATRAEDAGVVMIDFV
jgi:hypothetical protein